MKKKGSALLVVFLLLLCVFGGQGCTAQRADSTQQGFDAYVRQLPARFIDSDSMELNYLFVDKKVYGFDTDARYTLPFADQEDYEETAAFYEKTMKELAAFPDEKLREDQKLTKEVALDSMERNRALLQYYYLDNSFLGSYRGFQAQLPLLLAEYEFQDQSDLESYFHILETSPDVFQQYAVLEQVRQEKLSGMAPSVLKKVIRQCENFTKEKRPFFADTVNEKIDALSFLSIEEKTAAKNRNEALLTKSLIPAYQALGEALSQIKPTGADLGLSSMPEGKPYYEALLQAQTGTDWTAEEVKTYLHSRLALCRQQVREIQKQHPGIVERFVKSFGQVPYPEVKTPREMVDSLRDACAKEFPALSRLNYEVKRVPSSMAENFSPAAYLQGRLDAPADTPESIWINGEFSPSLYPVFAHEGYPGHMYQHSYYKSTGAPTLRFLLDYRGYSEGWASYVELSSWRFISGGEEQRLPRQMEQMNKNILGITICLWDIGVHYEGWDFDLFQQKAAESFGKGAFTEEALRQQFELILESPTNALQYYLNANYFLELYDNTKTELGSAFDPVQFHQVLLETGPAPQKTIARQVGQYINQAKSDEK